MDNREKTEGSASAPIAALEEAGVGYALITHPAANTMELCRGIGEEYGARHCKNLFLTNKRGSEFRLLLMHPDKPFRTSEVSKALGVTRMSFASNEQLKEVLGLEPGCVSVMGLVNECAKRAYVDGRLFIAIDGDILKWDRICVHPNTDEATLVMETAGLIRFLEHIGVSYSVLEI
jgi:Ala-tRNA(Pro) deacylase